MYSSLILSTGWTCQWAVKSGRERERVCVCVCVLCRGLRRFPSGLVLGFLRSRWPKRGLAERAEGKCTTACPCRDCAYVCQSTRCTSSAAVSSQISSWNRVLSQGSPRAAGIKFAARVETSRKWRAPASIPPPPPPEIRPGHIAFEAAHIGIFMPP